MSQTQSSNPSPHAILFFDGYCSLCNWSVDFVMRRDKKAHFQFASLQSETAKKLLPEDIVAQADPDSLIVYQDGLILDQLDAVLYTAQKLGFPYNLSLAVTIFPCSWRNGLYKLVARNRYRWFGKRDTCRMPTEEERGRMLG